MKSKLALGFLITMFSGLIYAMSNFIMEARSLSQSNEVKVERNKEDIKEVKEILIRMEEKNDRKLDRIWDKIK